MSKNTIARIFKIVGICEIVCGIFSGLSFINDTGFTEIGLTIIVGSLMTALIVIGFGEVIKLLQENVNHQKNLMEYLVNKSAEETIKSVSVLQDIEDNLPDM